MPILIQVTGMSRLCYKVQHGWAKTPYTKQTKYYSEHRVERDTVTLYLFSSNLSTPGNIYV
jgi:hypothetical protein